MYMRTGSVVRPVSVSSADNCAAASSAAVSSTSRLLPSPAISRVSASGATSCTSMPMPLIMLMMSSICSGSTRSSGK